MKIELFELEFDADFYYIERETIVERITFNNRTLYSRFEKIEESPTPLLLKQHLQRELTIALPLVDNVQVNYIVLSYEKEEENRFFHLIKHLLKSLEIEIFYTYESSKKNHIQIFIPRKNLNIQDAYAEVEKIERMIELKSSKRCKILPNKNLPIKYNKITLPIKKM